MIAEEVMAVNRSSLVFCYDDENQSTPFRTKQHGDGVKPKHRGSARCLSAMIMIKVIKVKDNVKIAE
jgi:hypothetical protein